MLEQQIERLAKAIEANTEALLKTVGAAPVAAATTASAPAGQEEKKSRAERKAEKAAAAAANETKADAAAAPAGKVTIEQLRAAGTKVISAGKADDLKKLLTEFKVEKLSALAESDYADVLTKLQALAA